MLVCKQVELEAAVSTGSLMAGVQHITTHIFDASTLRPANWQAAGVCHYSVCWCRARGEPRSLERHSADGRAAAAEPGLPAKELPDVLGGLVRGGKELRERDAAAADERRACTRSQHSGQGDGMETCEMGMQAQLTSAAAAMTVGWASVDDLYNQ